MNKLILLGGSYNPVHIGHLRLAIELSEKLNILNVDLIPCALPAHKNAKKFLPFDLRLQLLELSLQSLSNPSSLILQEKKQKKIKINVNPLEGLRQGNSYSYDTLFLYKQQYPNTDLYFALAATDFTLFDKWHKWTELIKLATLLIIPRTNKCRQTFKKVVYNLWPKAEELCPEPPFKLTFKPGFEEEKNIYFLNLPKINISSSLIRQKWLKNENLGYLLPEKCLTYLYQHRGIINSIWNE